MTLCIEIDLADEIGRIVGVDPRQKVTCGEAVVAMVLSGIPQQGRRTECGTRDGKSMEVSQNKHN